MRSNRFLPIIPLRSSLLFVALVGCLIGMGPAPLLGRHLFRWAQTTRIDRRNRWQGLMAFALLGAVFYAGLWHFESPVHQLLPKLLLAIRTHNMQRVAMYLLAVWLYNTLLTPFMAVLIGIPLVCSAWIKRSRHFTQRGSCHHVKEVQENEDELTLAGVVTKLASLIQNSYPGNASLPPPASGSAHPLQANGPAIIGRPLGGDLDWEKGGWFTFPLTALQEHGVICGGTGSGKTSLAIRLAAVASSVYGFRVYYVDSKADIDTAAQFVTAMEQQGFSDVRLFPHEPFDGWRGSSRDLRNRLIQLLTYSEHYYADGARLLLGLALDAPGGVPRSSDAFLKRLDREVLEELYRGTPRLSRLKRIPFVHIDGTMVRYESFFTAAGDLLDGTWAWEDTRAAYIGLDSLGQRDDTLALGRFFIEDFSHFIKPRRKTLAFKRRDTRRAPDRPDGQGGKPLVSGLLGAKKSGIVWANSSAHTVTGAIQLTSNNTLLLAPSAVRAGSTTGPLQSKAGSIKRRASASLTAISPPVCRSSKSKRRRLGWLRFPACPYNKACVIWIVPSSISSRGEGNTRASSRKSEAFRRRPTPLPPSPGRMAPSRWQKWTPRSQFGGLAPCQRERSPRRSR